MFYRHVLTILMAYLIDLIIGDPYSWPHPVKMIGSLIHFLDQKLNKDHKRDGIVMLGLVLITVTLASISVLLLAYKVHIILGLLVESILIATTISQKGLKDAAMAVYQPLVKNQFLEARDQLSHIVGRDTDSLNEAEITRATVETVAENTTDGITAPIFWAFIAGGWGAIIYRAINTCDSMVGYQNERYQHFGWASAKLDDFVNWIPARLTGTMMLYLTTKDSLADKKSIQQLRMEAKKHPSPNSGWTEAAVALALGIELGGNNYYQGVLFKAAKIGQTKREIVSEDIKKTVKSMQITSLFFVIILMLGALIYGLTKTWI